MYKLNYCKGRWEVIDIIIYLGTCKRDFRWKSECATVHFLESVTSDVDKYLVRRYVPNIVNGEFVFRDLIPQCFSYVL